MLFLAASVQPLSAAAQGIDTVDVGGHTLEVQVLGSGTPVVVFEAGLSKDLATWEPVVNTVAEFTTTVAYSRAGYAGSEVGPNPRSPEQINSELRTLLGALKLQPPYVLVGHSLGGLYVRAYYYNYPDEVAGLVLVDGSHERQFMLWKALDPSWDVDREMTAYAAEWPVGAQQETVAWLEIGRQGSLLATRPLVDLPVYILTADVPAPEDTSVVNSEAGRKVWRELHAELFAGVHQGAHIVTSRSNHFIHQTEPSLVVWSIRQLVDAARRTPPN